MGDCSDQAHVTREPVLSAFPVIKDQIKGLPARPGIYLFKDDAGNVVYVGKAKSLRPRVRSYFRSSNHSLKTLELVRHVHSVETIVVGSEAEALILEANLIKEHRPRFNIQLRDDKRYPYIKVTTNEPFPRVFVTRKLHADGSRYFGPYTSVGSMREALEVIKRLYTVRSCRYDLPSDTPERPCLDYHIGRCLAPCVGLQDQDSYRAMIDEILKILDGDTEDVRKGVEERMREASLALEFERAARLRDVLGGLDALARHQRVEKLRGGHYDVVGLARDRDLAATVVMRIRRGVLWGRDTQRFSGVVDETDESLITTFVSRYYLSGEPRSRSDLPREILIPLTFPDQDLVEEILADAAGRRVEIRVPQRGAKRRLAELAGDNARHALEDRLAALEQVEDRAEEVLYDLRDRLDLKVVPRLMVCFDISHTQGTETVGSAAVFENAEPKKAEYRHMRIKGDWGNDDYRSMAEVVTRYFRRRLDEGRPLPDLVLIDGGKGQFGGRTRGPRRARRYRCRVGGPGEAGRVGLPAGSQRASPSRTKKQGAPRPPTDSGRGPSLCRDLQSEAEKEAYAAERSLSDSGHWPRETEDVAPPLRVRTRCAQCDNRRDLPASRRE